MKQKVQRMRKKEKRGENKQGKKETELNEK